MSLTIEEEFAVFTQEDYIALTNRVDGLVIELDTEIKKHGHLLNNIKRLSDEFTIEKGKVVHLEGEVERITAQRDEALKHVVEYLKDKT